MHPRRLVYLTVILSGAGCETRSPAPDAKHDQTPAEVVAYVSLDREFSAPLLRRFESQTGIRVLAKHDIESTKTVGLVTALVQEGNRPRCDLFWNNEILHTLRLQQLGLLDVYLSPAADHWPREHRDPDSHWYALAARARVLIVNTQIVPLEDRPRSVLDLAQPQWRGRVGFAKPLFGTTATHAAVLFATWGDTRARAFFHDVRENAQVLSGNKQVALDVAEGRLAWGLTDTDDAIIEQDRGAPVAIVFPDQEPDQLGTLLIPNTIALIKGGPHPHAARRLLDFLLTPEVERELAAGASGQIPLNPLVAERSRIQPPATIRWMQADFAAAAAGWDAAAGFLKELFATGT